MQKEKNAISVLRSFEPDDGEGYYLCYSGGKDSDCIRILAALAGVKHDIVHNLTTIDFDVNGKKYSRSAQVARCGNAVPPPFAEALVRANLPEMCGKKYETMQELRMAM